MNWRRDWNNPKLKFLIVQLSSYGGSDPDGEAWAIIREAQLNTVKNGINAA